MKPSDVLELVLDGIESSMISGFLVVRDVASVLQGPIDIIIITLQEVQELKNKQALIEKLRKELISSSDVEPRVT